MDIPAMTDDNDHICTDPGADPDTDICLACQRDSRRREAEHYAKMNGEWAERMAKVFGEEPTDEK